jgi:uncharacterized ParB-like nuclease family protein
MKQIKASPVEVDIDKVVTLSDLGVTIESMSQPKQDHIARLVENGKWYPIVVTPIKDSGYYLLADGWHRLQAAKQKKMQKIKAINLPANEGLYLGKYFVLGDEMYNSRKHDDWVILTHGTWSKVIKARKNGEELQIELVDNDTPLLLTDSINEKDKN